MDKQMETLGELAARGKARYALYREALGVTATHGNATAFVLTARNADGSLFFGDITARSAADVALLLALEA